MDLQRVSANNWQQLQLLDINLTGSVAHLFAGDNEVGKSSVVEAIYFALFGEALRVSKKGDYPMLIREGAKSGFVEVEADGRTFRRDVKTARLANPQTGKLPGKDDDDIPEPDLHDRYRLILFAQRIAQLGTDQRRTMLMESLGARIKTEKVREKLAAKKVPDEAIELAIPLLGAGFGAAEKEAKQRVTQAKAAWESVTGEKWGSVKGETWEADVPEFDRGEHDNARSEADKRIAAIDEELEQVYGEKAIVDAGMRAKTCPHCQGLVQIKHNNGETVLGKFEGNRTSKADVEELNTRLTSLRLERSQLEKKKEDLRRIEDLAARADERTEGAKTQHQRILMWDQLAKELAPDGIPSEILSDLFQPLNDRLKQTADLTGWDQVKIRPDCEVEIAGRPYRLRSESAQWRADAALADAISHASGMGILVLDRCDVLVPDRRISLVQWLDKLAQRGDYNRILVLGSFKAPPFNVADALPSWTVHWIENGEIVESRAGGEERQAATA